MTSVYRTQANDMLDAICHRHYGYSEGVVEQVLEVNPDLAELGPMLPAGITIYLSEISKPSKTRQTVRLWDL